MNTTCVYILKSTKDNKKYIGSTTDLDRRINQHTNGMVKSTKYRLPLKLIAYQCTNTIEEAAVLEKKYKRSHDALERAIKAGKFTLFDTNF